MKGRGQRAGRGGKHGREERGDETMRGRVISRHGHF